MKRCCCHDPSKSVLRRQIARMACCAVRCMRALSLGLTACVAVCVHAAIPAAERQALQDIYAATGGAGWTGVAPTWTGAAGTECSWGGVTCDAGQSTVVEVNLSVRNLVGTLPASINQLVNLRGFTADGNRLTGGIPALTGLTALELINLSRNQLDGSIGAWTGLSSLQIMQASDNRLTGGVPALTGLTALRDLRLNNNRLSGNVPALTGLGSLQSIDLSGNQLSGNIPALTGLAQLQNLWLQNNRLSGSLPSFAGLSALTGVDVGNNLLTGAITAVPSPNNLIAGNSRLCPNALTTSIDTAWNAATGVTPWSRDCTTNFTVTPVAAANGEIFPGTPQLAGANGIASFSITPNVGYGVVVGGSCPAGSWLGSRYTIVFINASCTVAPVFDNRMFAVTISSTGPGNVSPSGVRAVLFGSYVTFAVNPDPGFRARAQTTCGSNGYTTAGNQFTTASPVTADCAITVSFVPISPQVTITPVAGAHGRISPATPFQIAQGGRTELTITADPGYIIASVSGCGGTLAAGGKYVTGAVTADCVVTASFAAAAAAQQVPVNRTSTLLALLLLLTAGNALRRRRAD